MFRILLLISLVSISTAFTGSMVGLRRRCGPSMAFDLDKAVNTLAQNKILTKTSQLGLLSRLEKAGFKLSSAKPLLKLADEQDLIGVLEASSDKVLPLIATAIESAPALLPIAGSVLKLPSTTLFGGAAASLAAAGLVIVSIPDDSVLSIAEQVALVIPLGAIIPGALGVGGLLLSKLK
eukprot:gene6915-9468_t